MRHASRDQEPAFAEALLVGLFLRNGYVRSPSETRRDREGREYKKGYEVRLVLNTREELAQARRLLAQAGLRAGRPFAKHRRIVQPIYGREALERFLEVRKKARGGGKP
jgi:hypothetical protein